MVGSGSVFHWAVAGLLEQKDPPPPKAEAEAVLKKSMLEDARKVFEMNIKRYQTGAGALVAEELYQWSNRWLKAELDLAGDAVARTTALKAHLNRMKEVEKQATTLAKIGQGRDADAAAGRYFRAQAELWVGRGRVR